MICAIINTYRDRKIRKTLSKIPFHFIANLEVPDPRQLQADIIDVSPKPVIIVFPNDAAESMSLDGATSSLMAMDLSTLKKKLAAGGLAWVPGSLVNKDALGIPDLQVITTEGEGSLADIPKDVLNNLLRLSKEERVTLLKEEMNGLILPYETANQLWGMQALYNLHGAYNGDGIKHVDKMKCAKILGKSVPYQKRCDVRTMRVEVTGMGNGLKFHFI